MSLFKCGYRLLTESPRWLIMTGKFKKADKVIRHIAAINNMSVPDDLKDKMMLIKDENIMKSGPGYVFLKIVLFMCVFMCVFVIKCL